MPQTPGTENYPDVETGHPTPMPLSNTVTPGSQAVDTLHTGKSGKSNVLRTPGMTTPMTVSPTMAGRPTWFRVATKNLQVADPSLLRGIPASSALRGFSTVLSDRPPTAEYYEMSAEVTALNTFVSHNWSTPRWKKFLVLAFHFNILPALVISIIVAACIAVLTTQGLLPHVVITKNVQGGGGGSISQGLLCLPVGLLVFMLCLLGLHEIRRLFLAWPKCHTVFLDKCCVHQLDMKRKREGIQSLAAIMHNSSDILVLYSDIYMQKLWTVYEVASWLMLHPHERMLVRPVQVPILLSVACVCFCACEALLLAAGFVEVGMPKSLFGKWSFPTLLTVPAISVCTCLAARWAADRERIEQHLARFTLADAQCASEDDRAVVQKNIVAFMKFGELIDPDATDEVAFEAFEELVRREVPRLFFLCFGRVGVPYHWALIVTLPRALCSFDMFAGAILDHQPPAMIALWCAMVVAIVLTIGPLLLATIVGLMRHRRLRSPPVCVAVGLLASYTLWGFIIGFAKLTRIAPHSHGHLTLLFSIYAILAAATVLVYCPRCQLSSFWGRFE